MYLGDVSMLLGLSLSIMIRTCWSSSIIFPTTKPEECSPLNGQLTRCVPKFDCLRSSDGGSVLTSRLHPCGLGRFPPHVCCPTGENVQFQCGKPGSTLLHQSTEPLPVSPPPLHGAEQSSNVRRHEYTARADRLSTEDHSIADQRGSTELVGTSAIGGLDADVSKWLWIALFGRRNNGQLSDWFCGGTLISVDYVLTAAHCIGSASESNAGVRLGDHDLSTNDETEHQERSISRLIIHERYQGSQNDIALVKLSRPARLTESVRPICLPDVFADYRPDLGVSMAGWGLLKFKGTVTPHVLQEVALKLSDTNQCEAAYQQLPTYNGDFPGGFQNTKLCAVSRDDEIRGACTGDSGGPLMRQSSTDGIYELIGVVSTGVGCGHPDYPGVYTRVSAYIDWIKRNSHGIF